MVRVPDGNSSIRNQGILTNWLASRLRGRLYPRFLRLHGIAVLLGERAQRAFGPRPQMLDDFGRAQGANSAGDGELKPAGEPEQEPGCEQVAGAGAADE